MGIGNGDDLDRRIALVLDGKPAIDQRLGVERLVDGVHLSHAEMRVDTDAVASLAAQQAPHRQADALAENVPERHFDAAHRGLADDADPPEAVLVHDAHELLDVARVLAENERLEVLNGADHGARFPFEGRLAPAV